MTEDAVAFIRALVNAWDCCATCAGGVLARRDRERDARRDGAPVRLCCGQRHSGGPVCPDGLVMCQLCFGRFPVDRLHVTEGGTPEDVCQPCAEREATCGRSND